MVKDISPQISRQLVDLNAFEINNNNLTSFPILNRCRPKKEFVGKNLYISNHVYLLTLIKQFYNNPCFNKQFYHMRQYEHSGFINKVLIWFSKEFLLRVDKNSFDGVCLCRKVGQIFCDFYLERVSPSFEWR